MIEVNTQGQATHYPHARALRTRKPRHIGRKVLLGVLGALAFFYAIGAHAQADAQPTTPPPACAAQGMMFNPCATLDPSQVQDRRVSQDEATCRAAAQEMHTTHDYTGTDTVVRCFGEEDSERTGLALDTGMTYEQYREYLDQKYSLPLDTPQH